MSHGRFRGRRAVCPCGTEFTESFRGQPYCGRACPLRPSALGRPAALTDGLQTRGGKRAPLIARTPAQIAEVEACRAAFDAATVVSTRRGGRPRGVRRTA